MDKICCVMDAQGFVKNKRFYPREISILSHTLKQTVLCDTSLIKSEMNLKDRKTNDFLANNILGMSMGTYDLDIKHRMTDDAAQMILILYEKVHTEARPVVAIKNDQLKEILDDWGIPYIDISCYGCPNIKKLKQQCNAKICHFHEREVPDRSRLRCAEQKCEIMWNWIINYLKTN